MLLAKKFTTEVRKKASKKVRKKVRIKSALQLPPVLSSTDKEIIKNENISPRAIIYV